MLKNKGGLLIKWPAVNVAWEVVLYGLYSFASHIWFLRSNLYPFHQVNVNVIEAQKLVGVNINPAVYVTIGDEKKHTATQKSTNCPFYNEVNRPHILDLQLYEYLSLLFICFLFLFSRISCLNSKRLRMCCLIKSLRFL